MKFENAHRRVLMLVVVGGFLLTACGTPKKPNATPAPAGPSPSTTAAEPTNPNATACYALASFEYFRKMPDSGKVYKDPIATDAAAVAEAIAKSGDMLTVAIPELADSIKPVVASKTPGQSPDPKAVATAVTALSDWEKSHCR